MDHSGNLIYSNMDSNKKIYESPYKKYMIGNNIPIKLIIFCERFNKATDGLFKNFSFINTFISGGLISGMMEVFYDETIYKNFNIDIFVYSEYTNILKQRMFDAISNIVKELPNSYILYSRKNGYNIYNILSPDFPRIIKIVGYLLPTAKEVIRTFDLTHSQVGFDGTKIICTKNYLDTCKTRTVKIKSQSVSISKLIKAYNRGYNIQISENIVVKLHQGQFIHPFKIDFSSINFLTNNFSDINVNKKKSYIPTHKEKEVDIILNLSKHYPNTLQMKKRVVDLSQFFNLTYNEHYCLITSKL